MKKLVSTSIVASVCLLFAGCSDAEVVSHNLSKDADMFKIERRVIFYNGVTGDYMLSIEGKCSIEPENKKLAVTCKVGDGKYKKHYLGLSDNVTYFVEQLEEKNVSAYHYKVIFKPQAIIPDIDMVGSLKDSELPK